MLVQVPKDRAIESLMYAERSIKDNGARGKLLLRYLCRIKMRRNGEIHRPKINFQNANKSVEGFCLNAVLAD